MMKIALLILSLLTLSSSNCSKREGRMGGERQRRNGADSVIRREVLPRFKSAAFISSHRAWLTTVNGDVLRTEDGGLNWIETPSNNGEESNVVTFINSQQGWMLRHEGIDRYSQLLLTEDTGQTWIAIAQIGNDDQPFTTPSQILFVDELHGWAADSFSVWRTDNGGANWERCFNQVPVQPEDLFFLNSLRGWLLSTDGMIHRTENGGRTWQQQNVAIGSLLDVYFVDDRTGWVAGGRNGGIYRSDDAGDTWLQQLTNGMNISINSIHFTSKNEGWAVGRGLSSRNEIEERGIILHTLNGGRNWQPIQIGENEPFFERIHFTDSRHGWLIARDNVYRTEDGGQTWRAVLQLPPIRNPSS